MMGSIALIYIRVQWRRERNGIRGETEGHEKKGRQEKEEGKGTKKYQCERRVWDGLRGEEEHELKFVQEK